MNVGGFKDLEIINLPKAHSLKSHLFILNLIAYFEKEKDDDISLLPLTAVCEVYFLMYVSVIVDLSKF